MIGEKIKNMSKIKKEDIEKIKRIVMDEFPNDPALQQVHIARKIIAKEAELEGLSFIEYIQSKVKQVKSGT